MVISKIPKKQVEFIEGNSEIFEKEKTQKLRHIHNVLVRIPDEMIQKIEEQIQDRSVKISRNTWILEAINAYLV